MNFNGGGNTYELSDLLVYALRNDPLINLLFVTIDPITEGDHGTIVTINGLTESEWTDWVTLPEVVEE